MEYEVIIIGSGPAGLTAAIYAARYKLKTLVLGQLHGGIASEAWEICNFPTYGRVKGFELMMKMIKQVESLGVEIKNEEVLDINDKNIVKTNKKEYSAKKIIIATGTERKRLGVDKEKEFLGKGISYCATCDGGFFKDKIAGVVGGSDAALTAALLLSRFAKKVYIFYRKDKFYRAEPSWIEEVEKEKKIEPIFNVNVEKLIGKEKLEKIKLDNGEEINIDGLFIEIGSTPNSSLGDKLGLDKTEEGYILTDERMRTNKKNIFACGDVRKSPIKQIITACSDGAIAANCAYEEIQKDE
jgi:thioredoxin reductase (NADPH)